MKKIEKGRCACGCQGLTKLAPQTRTDRGWIKGQPKRFLPNHHMRLLEYRNKPRKPWKGGRTISSEGYVFILRPDHPNANSQGYVREHLLVAEKALGKYLPTKTVIHHIDEDRTNNSPNNLVLCQDAGYHAILHRRLRALRECGNANYRLCTYCKKYDSPENLTINTSIINERGSYYTHSYHWACGQAHRRAYRLANLDARRAADKARYWQNKNKENPHEPSDRKRPASDAEPA